jgi:transcriptional regulator with XRE-family HTH domain
MTRKRAGAKGERLEPPGFTRIAGSLLRLHRTKREFSQGQAAALLHCDPGTWSRAERGESRLRFFRANIGALATSLRIDANGLALLLNGLWADELLAAFRAVSKTKKAGRSARTFPLLQWLWYDSNARTWLKLLIMQDPSPWLDRWPELAAVPCLARHPALKHYARINLGKNERIRSSKGGAARDTPHDALGATLAVDATSLREAVLSAQEDAIAALRGVVRESPAVGDLLLLFADAAAGNNDRGSGLRCQLKKLDSQPLHAIDARYRARALYRLGDHDALCPVVESTFESRDPSILRYYREQSGGDREGTQTLADMCSKLEFALNRRSIPLVALYLGTVLLLIKRLPTAGGWSQPLGNFSTSLRLAAILNRADRWLADIGGPKRKRRGGHHCPRGSTGCFERACAAAEEIQAAIGRARAALRAADDEERL